MPDPSHRQASLHTCRRSAVLVTLAALVCAFPGSQTARALNAVTTPADADIRKIIAERVDVHRQTIGIVVGITDASGHRFLTHGARAQGDTRPLDGNTVFEIGSITKVFTSLLLADAVRRGEVALTDPIATLLPAQVKVPERNGRRITLVDLATHTSGLPSLPTNFTPQNALNPYADYSIEQLYTYLGGVQLTRDIGSRYEYSNLAVGLLGHLLSRRTGMDYESLVRTRVTGPLGMGRTSIALSDDMRARLATGHSAALEPTPNWDLPALAGAGALRSTTEDMLTFLDAAIGTRASPLSQAFADMLTVRRPTGQAGLEVALGWHVLGSGDEQIIWHNGGTGGYRTWAGYDPRARRGVVVLTNTGTPNGPDDIGRHILNAAFPLMQNFAPPPAPQKPRTETSLAPSIFDRYVGRYQLAPALLITVSRDGTRFIAQLTGQPPAEIYAESEKDFFYKIVDAQLTFQIDATGKATAVVLHQNGVDQRAARIDGEPVAPKEITLAPAILDRYAGRYQLAPGVFFNFRRDGARFIAQLTGQQPIDIYAESETRFFYKVVDAQLTFETTATGEPTAVVLHQNGLDQRALRVADPAAITLDAAVLERYVGRYQLAPGVFMIITREGGRLFGQPTGQSQQEIVPTAPNEFFVKGLDAQMLFDVDASGKSTALTVRMNGRDQRATRVD